MSLPNYTPSGTISFGSVPWDNGYANVRLYTSLSEQQGDISSCMTASSSNYVYIAQNRRLKVDIEVDRLYHCNYCMYRNASLGTGWVYCFVRDVKYLNDNTTEVLLETDIFQTYLYGVDWQVPACFIERETVPSEDSKYLYTSEPDFPLTYVIDSYSGLEFDQGAVIIQTSSLPQANETIVDAVLNPQGYYAEPAEFAMFKGTPQGAAMYGLRTSGGTDGLAEFLEKMNYAGATEAIVSIFSIPTFAATALGIGASTPHLIGEFAAQDDFFDVSTRFAYPARGSTVDGYTPHNAKLLYWPFNFLRLTDYNGSEAELRYELIGENSQIDVKYAPTPSCKALAYPTLYAGAPGQTAGITIACGAIGSWSNNQFQQWVAQNSGTILLTVAGAALLAAGGAATVAGASGLLAGATTGLGAAEMIAGTGAAAQGAAFGASQLATGAGLGMVGNAASQVAGLGAQALNASKHPTVTRGQSDPNVLYMTGMQGVWAQKVCVKSEIAEQIDEFFDRFGYAVERIESVNITSRPAWNYVKTGGAAPKSLNAAAGAGAPFSRGRGTPAAALNVIRRAFDSGITFWHTTSGFGDYSQDNSL